MGPILIGFTLLLIGAACGGSFGLPSKYVKKDTPWEVLWGPFFFFVAIVIPGIVAPLVTDDLFGIFAEVGFAKIVPVLIFGLLWGLGSITLGKAFAFIGLSLAYALNYGTQIITGSVVPMAIHTPGEMGQTHGLVILAGVAVCVLGVIVAGRAAILKERSSKAEADESPSDTDSKSPKMLIGLIIGILSGVLCACYSIGFSFAGPVNNLVAKSSTAAWATAWAPTALILWGGALSACGYGVWELTKNKTWGQLAGPGIGRTLILAFVMAILHDAAVLFFGLGAIHIGNLGESVGYAVFMSFGIIVGNFHGFRTGEWKGASPQSVKLILAGIAILILGVAILGTGKWMAP
ncbi:MAG: L-rhamnose/proton symporter RhaT [Phycisphaerae bacterium]|jgi:L-rhamnose-H+ transport protein|nr:L-rhamnose/proton symporter RhaT [Phycisphaerae bacterium]